MAKQKTAPKPELVYEIEGAPKKLFLVWDDSDLLWFIAENHWTPKFLMAGTFAEEQAREIAGDRYEVRSLETEVRLEVTGANAIVLQAIAALGGR